MAELEGGSVVFFAVSLGLGMMEAGSNVECRVISYAWNWVLRCQPLIGGIGCWIKELRSLHITVITMWITDVLTKIIIAHSFP